MRQGAATQEAVQRDKLKKGDKNGTLRMNGREHAVQCGKKRSDQPLISGIGVPWRLTDGRWRSRTTHVHRPTQIAVEFDWTKCLRVTSQGQRSEVTNGVTSSPAAAPASHELRGRERERESVGESKRESKRERERESKRE